MSLNPISWLQTESDAYGGGCPVAPHRAGVPALTPPVRKPFARLTYAKLRSFALYEMPNRGVIGVSSATPWESAGTPTYAYPPACSVKSLLVRARRTPRLSVQREDTDRSRFPNPAARVS